MRKAEIDSGINILGFLQNKTHRDILTRGFENAVHFSGSSCSKNVEISKRLQLQLKKKKKEQFPPHSAVSFVSWLGVRGARAALLASRKPPEPVGRGAHAVEVSPEQACSLRHWFGQGALLQAGKAPQELPSLKAGLRGSGLVWKRAQHCSTAPNRQRLGKTHFLTSNSFPAESLTLCKVSPSSKLNSLGLICTVFVQEAAPAWPPLQHWHFPGWQPKGCLGRHSGGQNARAGLRHVCSRRGRLQSGGLHLGKNSFLNTLSWLLNTESRSVGGKELLIQPPLKAGVSPALNEVSHAFV